MAGVTSGIIIGGLFQAASAPIVGLLRFALPPLVIGLIVMFGMVTSAGVSTLADVDWNRRNMIIFALALSLGIGYQQEPGVLQHLPETAAILLSTGLLPAAFIAIFLNLLLPEELGKEEAEGAGVAGLGGDETA